MSVRVHGIPAASAPAPTGAAAQAWHAATTPAAEVRRVLVYCAAARFWLRRPSIVHARWRGQGHARTRPRECKKKNGFSTDAPLSSHPPRHRKPATSQSHPPPPNHDDQEEGALVACVSACPRGVCACAGAARDEGPPSLARGLCRASPSHAPHPPSLHTHSLTRQSAPKKGASAKKGKKTGYRECAFVRLLA